MSHPVVIETIINSGHPAIIKKTKSGDNNRLVKPGNLSNLIDIK